MHKSETLDIFVKGSVNVGSREAIYHTYSTLVDKKFLFYFRWTKVQDALGANISQKHWEPDSLSLQSNSCQFWSDFILRQSVKVIRGNMMSMEWNVLPLQIKWYTLKGSWRNPKWLFYGFNNNNKKN